MEIGRYEKAMKLCKEAAKVDISDLASKRILAEIYYCRAQGLSGAPGEEPLEEPIGKFVEIYNSFYFMNSLISLYQAYHRIVSTVSSVSLFLMY